MKNHTGGCGCGAIRYTVATAPIFSFLCLCRQCQRITGGGHAPTFAAPADAFTLKGSLRFHKQPADSGNTVSNGFCPTCGNPILKKSSGYPDRVYIHAASLDHPEQFNPEKIVFESARQPWDRCAL